MYCKMFELPTFEMGYSYVLSTFWNGKLHYLLLLWWFVFVFLLPLRLLLLLLLWAFPHFSSINILPHCARVCVCVLQKQQNKQVPACRLYKLLPLLIFRKKLWITACWMYSSRSSCLAGSQTQYHPCSSSIQFTDCVHECQSLVYSFVLVLLSMFWLSCKSLCTKFNWQDWPS